MKQSAKLKRPRLSRRAVQHVVQVLAALKGSLDLAVRDCRVRVIVRVAHLLPKTHKPVAACLRML